MSLLSRTERFIAFWITAYKTGQSVRWVSEKIGMKLNGTYSKAYYLRQRGVKLPRLQIQRRTKHLDVENLNDKIDRMMED